MALVSTSSAAGGGHASSSSQAVTTRPFGDATTGGAGCCGSAGDATSGDAYGGDVTQSQDATNSNSTPQDASAESKAEQTLPVNVAVSVSVAYSCDTGGVEQSNTSSSGDAWAGNENHTGQSSEQSQTGVGGKAETGDATATGGCCKPEKHSQPECRPRHGKDKGHPRSECDKGRCEKPERGGDAVRGEAKGGDVDQRQQASNDNRTSQVADARSKAEQKAPLDLIVTTIGPKPAPAACKPCWREEDVKDAR